MGLFKTLKGLFMKTSQKTIVLYTIELSEVDLDIAIENYPAVEKQVLDYISRRYGKMVGCCKDVSISMTVEFKTEGDPLDGFIPQPADALWPDIELSDRPEASSDQTEDIEPPPPDTESKDVIMDPGTMVANLAKDYKPPVEGKED